MADHKEILGQLSEADRVRLTERRDAPGLRHLVLHVGAILGFGVLISVGVPGWQFLLPLQGLLIVFLFTLLHEAIHETPFASPWLNRFAARVAGFVILLPPIWFRYFHFAHHRHTQDPERDPELAEPRPETWTDYALYLSGGPVWVSHIRTLLRNASGHCDEAFVPKARLGQVAREARLMLCGYAGLAMFGVVTGAGWILWVWLIPMVLGQPFLRLYLLAEHARCPQVANMFENTRTMFTTGAVRWLAWNMPYHAEHHAMPTVPFHRLPDLHALVHEHLRETEPGYARFHRRYVAEFSR